MRNLVFWIFIGIWLCAAFATDVHLKSIRASSAHFAAVQPLYEREAVFPQLELAMEKYRRASGTFHKMYNAQIAASKTRVRQEVGDDLARLNQLSPTPEDIALSKSIQDQLDELLRLSAKYEPQLFLKDAYYKPDVQALHQGILDSISKLQTIDSARLQSLLSQTDDDGSRSVRWIATAELAILALVMLLMVRAYMMHIRPARTLASYARALAEGQINPESPKLLPGSQAEVARVLAGMARQLEEMREQRRKFIDDVIEDLRPGLAALKRAEDLDEAFGILSGNIEDLRSVAEISRIDQRVNAGVVDLSELLRDTCRRAARAGICPEVHVTLPELPTWVRVDSEKMERAIIQILSKLGDAVDSGKTLEAALRVREKSGAAGVEITIQTEGQRIPGAPEQDIARHWIAQKGLSLMLVQKILKAHGGSVSASGLMGSPVQISLKLPKSVLTDGLVSPGKFHSARHSVQRTLEVDNFNST